MNGEESCWIPLREILGPGRHDLAIRSLHRGDLYYINTPFYSFLEAELAKRRGNRPAVSVSLTNWRKIVLGTLTVFWTLSLRQSPIPSFIFPWTLESDRALGLVAGSNVTHGSFWGGRIAIQRNVVLLLYLKTILCSIFPLNCSKEPFCNICERFEAERKFAVFTVTYTIYKFSGIQSIRIESRLSFVSIAL